jgi:HD-like signal output (HDOD) protein
VAFFAIALAWPRQKHEQSDADQTTPNPDPSASAAGTAGPAASPEAEAEGASAAQATGHPEIMRRVHALALGTAIGAVPDLRGVHGEVAAGVRKTLAGIADKPNYAPRRPMLLPKLMQAMHDDEVSRRELARIIGTDPALAGALLRLANSPFYRIRPEPVESLDRAIALLGLEGMRSLIAAALMQPVFRSSGGLFATFGEVTWEHTLYSANAAEAHSAVLENSDPFAAQLLSLLMGLATMVLFRISTDEYLSRRQSPSTTLIASLIESEVPTLARYIASSWQLSDRIDSALADQSNPSGPQTSLGRSLSAGRFIGALAVLNARNVLDEEAVKSELQSTGPAAGAYERIWSRLRASRAQS